jgi:transcriptional regulator with XRE-family HTH domain
MSNNRIKDLRIERGLKQKEFAKMFNVPATTVSSWETGVRNPQYETMCELADYFGVSIDYLMGRSDVRYYKHEWVSETTGKEYTTLSTDENSPTPEQREAIEKRIQNSVPEVTTLEQLEQYGISQYILDILHREFDKSKD